MTEDVPCEFCGEMTNSLAGNPSQWPLFFTWPEGTGKMKGHHIGCVTDRLFRRHMEHDKEISTFYDTGKTPKVVRRRIANSERT